MILDKLYKSESDVLNLVDQSLKTDSGLTLTYMNQHCFNIYCSNKEYKNLLDSEFKVFLDGIGIYLVLRLFGYKNVRRFNATDFNENIFTLFSEQTTRLFLIGGRFEGKFIDKKTLQRKINVVGYQNGFFDEKDLPIIFEAVEASRPDAIVIGMGVPYQEMFANQLTKIFDNKIIICAGNFLEFFLGTKRRAPKIIRYSGFEWLFRLITEPARLWKRYIVGIPLFFYNILKMKIDPE